jgi:aminoglycoside phosphotransferase (APT) family kinase protein
VAQFPGGFSNLTYLVRKGDREMVLRRPPRGSSVKSAHDMGREFAVLTALHGLFAKAPQPLAAEPDGSVLGAPFYLMERVPGSVLRRGSPVVARLTPAEAAGLSTALVDTMAELHALDPASDALRGLGRPEGYVERQVRGWSQRYVDARTDDVAGLERAMAWLEERRPGEGRAALVHNDFKHDNLVVDPSRPTEIRAVLDWEMATLGVPLLDLGTTLAYWSEPGDPPAWQAMAPVDAPLVPGSLDRQGVVARYAAATGREPGDVVFAYVFGVFKVAVIAQQIFVRFRQGLTADPRFAGLGAAVRACGDMASHAMERGRIDRLGD